MEEDGATLSVGFLIETGGSIEELQRMQDFMQSAEYKVLAAAKGIEVATGRMVKLDGATAQMTAFGSAATRELETVAQANRKASASAEAFIRKQEYQIKTFGMTQAAARAYFAELANDSDAAARLLANEAKLNALREKSAVGMQGVTKSSSQMRFAMQGASYQAQDLFTQLSMGANPINALAIQGGQLAGQFSNVENKAGNVARFMIGPWGLAITAGMLVLGPLVGKLLEGNNALDDAVDKLKKDAQQTGITARAKDMFRETVEGTTAALRLQEEALKQLEDQGKTAAQRASILAQLEVLKQEGIIETTRRLVEQAKAELALAESQRLRGGDKFERLGSAVIGAAVRNEIAGLEKAIGVQESALGKFEDNWKRIRSFRDVELGKLLADSAGKIDKKFDQRIDMKREELLLAGRGQEIAAETLKIELARAKALKDAVAQQKAVQDGAKAVGRETASAASVAAMLRKTMPGVQITSTTGGKHIDGSDHYKNRAVDFVPAGGMGSMTKSDVRAMIEKMGLDIRKNAGGVEQLFGPGDKGHSGHFHVAWVKGKAALDNYRAALREGNTEQREADKIAADIKRKYDDAVKGARDYADAQTDSARQILLSAKDQRAYADAVAISAAVTDKDKQAIREAAAVREAAISKADASAFQDNVIKPLQDELALYGLVGPARAAAALELEKEGFIAKNMGDGIAIATQRWNDYHAAKMGLINRDAAAEMEVAAIQRLNDHLSSTASLMDMIDQQAQSLGDSLGTAFGRVGEGLGEAVSALTNYGATQASLDAQRHADQVKYAKDAKLLGDSEVLYSKRSGLARQQAAMQAIGGIKSMFKEHRTAFKVMAAIEKGFAIWQAAQTAISIAQDIAKTVSHLANSGARATAAGAEGVATQSKLPFPYNIAAMAATAAALVAAGIAAFGGGGGSSGASMPSIEDVQAGQGTGTILGDSKAKSDSIARSLEIVAANTNRDLEYSNDMLKALRSIDTSIAKMAGTVARQIQLSGGLFDTSGQNLGTNSKKGFLGLFGGSTTTRNLHDLGMMLNSSSVGDIIANGISGQTYQIIEKVKKKNGFLGIGGSTKTSFRTTRGAIDPEITSAIEDVIASLRGGLLTAADVIGLEGAQAILDGFQVNLGKISFKDMTGAEIESQLNAVFSSIGDRMAGSIFQSLASMQLVGEGLFETFMRVAKEYQAVDVALKSIGRTFGQVGVESVAARDALVQLLGGVEEFMEATDFFRDQFLTEAQQVAPVQASVIAELQRLGAVGITTRDQFRQAVLGLDLTTEAGREMYASLMALAPAFDRVLDYNEQARKEAMSTLESTLETFQRLTEGLRKYRETLFATEAQGSSYAALRARFLSTSELAVQGDRDALGGLEGAGRAFLDASRNNASTREQYLRDVAIVARGVDAGIFAADATADYAKLQLDALTNATSILGSINANTAMTAEALVTAAGASSAVSAPASDNGSTNELRLAIVEVRDELAQLRADNNVGHATNAAANSRTARILEDVTGPSGGDAFNMVTTV